MRSTIERVLGLSSWGLKIMVYYLTHLIPRDRTVWVFGSHGGDTFRGNPKYQYIYMNRHHDRISAIWVTRDSELVDELRSEGLPAYHSSSLEGKLRLLRAGLVFNSHGIDIPDWWLVGGATIVQMWHSAAIKTFGWDSGAMDDMGVFTSFYYRNIAFNWDYLLVTSEGEKEKMSAAFRMDPQRVLITGYPRDDVLYSEIDGTWVNMSDEAVDRIQSIAAEHQIAAYIPTWRKAFGNEQGKGLSEFFDAEQLSRVLEEHDSYLLVKLHPEAGEDIDLDGYNRIIKLPKEFEITPILNYVDVLITDYSSVYVDYLLLNKPIIFYPYDLEDYLVDRELYHDYDSITPGPIVTDFESLCSQIDETFDGADEYRDERSEAIDFFYAHPDGNAAERVASQFLPNTD